MWHIVLMYAAMKKIILTDIKEDHTEILKYLKYKKIILTEK